jgi:hypothetical protein
MDEFWIRWCAWRSAAADELPAYCFVVKFWHFCKLSH